MMKQVLITLLLSASTFALATPAFAQTSNPDTTETDQSEEDWRKSKKKGGSSDDIIDIIKNTRSTGVGNGRGYSPIDSLPEESRRHLMKERAKRMAEAGVGEPVDVTYKPSPGAQGDPNLEADEKAAWEEMARGMNGAEPGDQGTSGGQSGQSGQMGQSQQSQQGQSSQGQSGLGQPGQQGQQGSGGGSASDGQAQGNSRSPSVMRGGSSASVADILSQIKGGGGAPSGTQNGGGSAPQGQQSGQGQQGQNQHGQAPSGSMSDGQSQAHGQAHAQNQAQGQSQNQGQSQAQNQANDQSASQSQSDAAQQAQAQSQTDATQQAQAQAQSEAEAAAQQAQNQRTPEPISPLDRLKDSRQERAATGSRSSASDYLKKKD